MSGKSLLSTITLAILAASAGIASDSPASAGGYGYGNSNSTYNSYQQKRVRNHAPRNVYQGSNPHLRWCYDSYKSYREADNTFQPYSGGRRECLSPYDAARLELFTRDAIVTPEAIFKNQGANAVPDGQNDEFGNQPEALPHAISGGPETEGQTDAFGNLSERSDTVERAASPAEAAVPARPAPGTENTGAVSLEPTPAEVESLVEPQTNTTQNDPVSENNVGEHVEEEQIEEDPATAENSATGEDDQSG